jgi:hypothetical protein
MGARTLISRRYGHHASAHLPSAAMTRFVRLLDAAAVVLAALGIWAVVSGGIRFQMLGLEVRATSVGRLLLELAVVTVGRHWLVPRPTILDRLRAFGAAWPPRAAAWRARWPALSAVAPIWLATRLSVLVAGYLGVALIGYAEGGPGWRISYNEFWNLPARWDTGWYLGIAAEGYSWNGSVTSQQNLNFFPALPMAMRTLGLFTEDALTLAWVGVAIGMLAFLGALLYLHRLMVVTSHASSALQAVTLMSVYPFALFFSAAYAESLYLLGAIGAFYHLRQRQPVAAAAWGLLAGLARPNGALLAVPLLAMVLTAAWHARAGAPTMSARLRALALPLAAASAPGVGAMLYSAFAYSLTGQAFVWAALQQQAWGRTLQGLDRTLIEPLWDMHRIGLAAYTMRQPVDTLHLAAALFALAAIWPVYRRFGLPYGLLIAVNTFAALLAGGLTSMGRFTSVLFPIFMWLGAAIPARHMPAWTAVLAMGQAIAAMAFFTWRSVF